MPGTPTLPPVPTRPATALATGTLPSRTGVGSALPASSFSDLLAQQLGGDTATAPGAAGDPLSQLTSILGGGKSGQSALDALATMSPELARAAAAAKRQSASKLTPKIDRAIAWSKKLIGRQDWDNLCERFVEEAYGTKNVFPTAAEASRRLVTHRGKMSWQDAPAGSLLYFAADESNDHNGHAGIYLGGGQMISATPTGVREDRLDNPYYADRFLGWAEPTRFPGRRTSSTSEEVPAGTPASLTDGAAAAAAAAASVTASSRMGSLLPPTVPRPAAATGSRPATPVPAGSATNAATRSVPAAATQARPAPVAVAQARPAAQATRPSVTLPPMNLPAPLSPLAQAPSAVSAAPATYGAPTAPRPILAPLAPLSAGGTGGASS